MTLRLLSSNGLYLELANVGSRVAKQVEVRCDPPIPWYDTLAMAPRGEFGPVEDFRDMDRDQRYVVLVGSPGPLTVDVLNRTSFTVSHESTWGFRRRKSKMRFGGSGGRSSLGEGAATPIGAIAETVKGHSQKLDEIKRAIEGVGHRLRPPAEGGDHLDLKVCAACGWERFTYYGSGHHAEFLCADCGTKHETTECECEVTWCEHRPAPRQCVRK